MAGELSFALLSLRYSGELWDCWRPQDEASKTGTLNMACVPRRKIRCRGVDMVSAVPGGGCRVIGPGRWRSGLSLPACVYRQVVFWKKQ
jgi:hypothetical protein